MNIFTGRHEGPIGARAFPKVEVERLLSRQGGNPVYSYGDTWAAGAPTVLPSYDPEVFEAGTKSTADKNSMTYVVLAGLAVYIIFFNK